MQLCWFKKKILVRKNEFGILFFFVEGKVLTKREVAVHPKIVFYLGWIPQVFPLSLRPLYARTMQLRIHNGANIIKLTF